MVAQAALFAMDDQTKIRMIIAALGLAVVAMGIYNIIVKRAWTTVRSAPFVYYRGVVTGHAAMLVGYQMVLGGILVIVVAFMVPIPTPPADRPPDRNPPSFSEDNQATPRQIHPDGAAPARSLPSAWPAAEPPSDSDRITSDPPNAVATTKEALESLRKKRADEEAARERERKGPDASDPDNLDKLADRMLSDDSLHRSEAIDALLKADPATAAPEAKKKVARAFKRLAEDDRHGDRDKVIKGLAIWGGKFSVPILLKMLTEAHSLDEEAILKTLSELNDPQAAPAFTARLGSFRFQQFAFDALTNMGSGAEDSVLDVARSSALRLTRASEEESFQVVVQLLGIVGTEKSLAYLSQLQSNRNRQIRVAAQLAAQKIGRRLREAKAKMKEKQAAEP